MEIEKLVSGFGFHAGKKPSKIGSGYINETYLVEDKNGKKGVLQKISTRVFKKPVDVMFNLQIILDILKRNSYPYRSFKIIPTSNGKLFIVNQQGFWRMISFLEGREAEVGPACSEKAEVVASGYGHFLKTVNQLDPELLKEVIPDFHNPEIRFRQFMESIESSSSHRLENAQSMADHAIALSNITVDYMNICRELPLRITHGDAKASNILVDDSENNVSGIIDLDTVMPGYIMNDFGDMVRSMCNTGKEDEKDIQKISLDLINFHGIAKGFLNTIHKLLSQEELDSLLMGIRSILYEQFIRFLADYLNGDIYYSVDYPEHNLDRARVHLKLLLDFQSREEQFARVLNIYLAEL